MPISSYLRGLRQRVGHELLLSPGVAAVIRDEAGRVLLERRADDGSWSLPAGSIDPDEEPARSLVREVWEETGLRVLPERILGVFGGRTFRHTYPNKDVLESTVVVFECRIVGGRLEARDGEAAELRFFAPAEMPPLVLPYPQALFEDHREVLFQWDDTWLDRED